jgi:hypothetical protein
MSHQSTLLPEPAPCALATGVWPESDVSPPPLPGFVVSTFSALAAEAARRCLSRCPEYSDGLEAGPESGSELGQDPAVTAVVVVSSLGDVASAAHVAKAVDSRGRVLPLLFFQSVPNSVAGYVAARWRLTGPVVSVGGADAGFAVAAQLIEDGDAERVLLVRVEQADIRGARDRAEALLLAAPEEES